MKLSEAPVNSVFYDNATLYNGQPIKWIVAAQNVDGDGIVSLMKYDGISKRAFDVKEPQNPDTKIVNDGNGSYEYSNLLQWLNSMYGANSWYSPQHQYDQSPNSANVGGTYASEAGFLNAFGSVLKQAMQPVSKMNVTRRVHLPSVRELAGSRRYSTQVDNEITVDTEAEYPGFSHPCFGDYSYQYMDPGALIRSNPKEESNKVGYAEKNASYPLIAKSIGALVSTNVEKYIIPCIYLPASLPITYSNGAYYLSYEINTPYSDYGSHKAGFSFVVNVTSGENGNVTAKVLIDGTQVKTTTISPNTDATITLADGDVSSLANTAHTVTIEATQNGITANTSFTYTKIPESIPVIYTNEIGHVAEPFETTYQVNDEDGDSIDVVIKLDNTTIISGTDVEQGVDLSIEITSSQFSALSYGEHTLTITATDSTNETTSRISFTKNSIPTVSINGIPTGLIIRPFSVTVDYDNADGEEVTISADIDGVPI